MKNYTLQNCFSTCPASTEHHCCLLMLSRSSWPYSSSECLSKQNPLRGESAAALLVLGWETRGSWATKGDVIIKDSAEGVFTTMSQSVNCRRGELVGVVHLCRGTNSRVTHGYSYTALWKRNPWQLLKIAARPLGKERRFTELSFSVPKKECILKKRFQREE